MRVVIDTNILASALMSEGGKADYLVTGDKSGLLALGRHKTTRIVSAKEFAGLIV